MCFRNKCDHELTQPKTPTEKKIVFHKYLNPFYIQVHAYSSTASAIGMNVPGFTESLRSCFSVFSDLSDNALHVTLLKYALSIYLLFTSTLSVFCCHHEKNTARE